MNPYSSDNLQKTVWNLYHAQARKKDMPFLLASGGFLVVACLGLICNLFKGGFPALASCLLLCVVAVGVGYMILNEHNVRLQESTDLSCHP